MLKSDMKKVLVTVLAFFAFGFIQAQDMEFGVKAGLLSSSYDNYRDNNYYGDNLYYDTYAYSDSQVGFYVGGFVDFELMEDFRLQPGLEFNIVSDNKALSIPVLLKYSFFDKFYAMAGVGLNYSFDVEDKEFSPSFDLGASYDLMEDFFVEVRADIGLGGYLNSNVMAGAGYRF